MARFSLLQIPTKEGPTMRKMRFAALLLALSALISTSAFAQQTTGNITGRVLDAQGAAVPGATVTARQPATGFTRTVTSDEEGVYRLQALPVGVYDLVTELSGFSTVEQKGIVVNVGQTLSIDFELKVAAVAETVTVTGQSPLIEATGSSVGGVVDIGRIESMPLNGRQFANLAATIPGVGLGFHSDPTKSTQYSPQVNGGNGRNVNYQIDGGDNNDDTVGGLLQLFPLEAIQEFNMITSRSKAEYGRSNGGVMNIVTKSGTNAPSGSFFTLFRDTAMNSITETEEVNEAEKQDYRRYQFGGSFGGPIVQDKAHFFAAAERTQQDTFQLVDTEGLFPRLDGIFPTPYRENLVTGKVTATLTASQYLSVRYGRNTNSQPYGASPQTPPNGWGTSENSFNSINLNHNWVLGVAAERVHLPVRRFPEPHRRQQPGSLPTVPEWCLASGRARTRRRRPSRRSGSSATTSPGRLPGMGGIGHDFKAGVNFINEPRLFITFNSGKGVLQHTHLTDDVNGPISIVTLNDGDASANIPLKQYAIYFQDDWRATDRLTINGGLRWDYITGYQFDQSLNPNFVKVQAAGAAGLLSGHQGPRERRVSSRKKTRTTSSRASALPTTSRATAAACCAAAGASTWTWATPTRTPCSRRVTPLVTGSVPCCAWTTSRAFGILTAASTASASRRRNIASQNEAVVGAFPLFGQWTDPRLEMPYTRQASLGWSHEADAEHGRDGRLRARRRPRPQRAPAHQRVRGQRRRRRVVWRSST